MLRALYRCVLRAHPPYFRQRFTEEMESIFDHAGSTGAKVGLLVDAGISLGRQWGLRPQFWEEPTVAAGPDGVPLFHTLGHPIPRTRALVYGALLSAFVLNGISWTMGYAWNHPIFIEFRQPVITPPASWAKRSAEGPNVPVAGEPPLYTDQGRVILIFNAPAHAGTPAPAETKTSDPANAPPNKNAHSQAPSASKQGMIF
jgi:hypothetical protein